MPAHAILIHIHTEPRTIETFSISLADWQWPRRDIFGQHAVRQRPGPVDVGNYSSAVQARGAGDARVAGLARNVHVHAQTVAEDPCLGHRADPAELDRLQADPASRLAFVVTPDVVERVNTFIGANGYVGCCRYLGHAVKIVSSDGLLEKIEPGSFYGAHIYECL